MKKNFLKFIINSTASILMLTTVNASTQTEKTANIILNKIKIVVDDKKVDDETLLYNDTTYLSLRSIAKIVGKNISYDKNTNTVYISDDKEKNQWSYSGETAPEFWTDLSPEYSAGKGKAQSPININTNNTEPTEELFFIPNFTSTKFTLENDGHSIQANPQSKSNYITIDNEKYYLQQFHLHSLSEHSINEKLSDMEVHFVHKTEDGKIAVIGVLIKEGLSNNYLKEIFEEIPTNIEKDIILNTEININNLLPKDSRIFSYSGSLTTPPLTEGVKWFVYENKITLSKNQIDNFKKVYNNNYRPVQPLNERIIKVK